MGNILVYGLVAGMATMMGSLIPFAWKWRKEQVYLIMALAAGVLLGAAFLHLLPEAIPLNQTLAGLGMLGAFLLTFAMEQSFLIHACPDYDEECEIHQMGLIAFGALFFHSLIDGLAIASGFRVSFSLGLVASTAVILHEFPEGLAASSLLISTGYSRGKTLLFALAVALATPIGAIVAYLFLINITKPVLALILGIAGGSFIYVGASDIIPRIHKSRSFPVFLFFLIGLALASLPLVLE